MGRSRTIVLFGLAALVGAACGSASSPDVRAPTTTAAPAQSVEGGLVGTWQGRGCSDNADEELLEATCLTLELDASHMYSLTSQSDYLESDLAGRWGVIAVDDVMVRANCTSRITQSLRSHCVGSNLNISANRWPKCRQR